MEKHSVGSICVNPDALDVALRIRWFIAETRGQKQRARKGQKADNRYSFHIPEVRGKGKDVSKKRAKVLNFIYIEASLAVFFPFSTVFLPSEPLFLRSHRKKFPFSLPPFPFS
jgi:hypothetical protein